MKPFCLFAILLTACAAERASGQSWFPEKDGRPRVAVVLSGGGARGLAHVGVLKVIEEVGMPIDLITGTSMGAVVGGLYASGYDAKTLAVLTTKTDWNTLLSDQPFRNRLSMDEKLRDGRYIADLPVEGLKVKLPSGLLSGQRAGVMLTRLTWPVHHIHDFSRLPIPFACLATDIETGEDVLLTEGYLPEAIRASMAIPSAFTPVDLDGRLLVDGGVVRNLPAVDARRLGADLVICSDVSRELSTRDELDSIISIMEQTFNFEYWASVSAQRRECDLVISPELDESGTFDFARADWIMEQGELAARNRLPRLEALADSVRRMGVWRRPWRPAEIDSVYVVDVEVEGLERVPAAVVVGQVDLPLPGWVTASDLEAAVDRIYSTRFFERVTYRIDAHSDGIGSALLIQTRERAEGEVRFGFRYDLRNQSRLIVATTFRNVISRGSKLVLETQIGNRMALASDYTLKMGLQGRLGIRFQGELVQDKFDEYLDGKPVAQLSTRSASFEAGLATVFSTRAYYGLSMVAEYARTAPRIAEIDGYQITTARLLMPAATIWIDTFDQLPFPRRGVFFFLRSTVAGKRFGSDLSMGQHLAIWSRAQPLFRWLTLFTDVECATTFGDRQAIPGGLRLGLGGLVKGPFEFGRFVGLASNERGGRYMTKAGARVQIEFQERRYLTLLWNVGTASNTWSWNVYGDNELIFGYGATLGLETIVGPVELTIGTGNRDRARITFNLGHRF